MVALLALFSDVVVPRVTELTASGAKPEAVEPADEEADASEAPEAVEEEEGDEGEVERLREENRALKELVGEKELALRLTSDD